jgi:uncharacterized protein (TIGR02145 family)
MKRVTLSTSVKGWTLIWKWGLIPCLCGWLCLGESFSQDTLYLFKHGYLVAKYPVAALDSMVFYSTQHPGDDPAVDADGNNYASLVLGTQVWLRNNLSATHFNDGSPIPLAAGNEEWMAADGPAYCWYNHESTGPKHGHGALYNWHVAHSGKICPTGWRVPTDKDWYTLIAYLDKIISKDPDQPGGKPLVPLQKSATSPDDAIHTTGIFMNSKGGGRNSDGVFHGIGVVGYFWSWTECGTDGSVVEATSMDYPFCANKSMGYSIRCIRE